MSFIMISIGVLHLHDINFAQVQSENRYSCTMGSSEKLCLQWNDFKENITSSFKELREDKEFSDVTLACEDGQQIEAHKIVLASSSPFFKELLKKHKHPHPLVYMRGLRSEDLMAIMDFLYFGEVNICQDNLDPFLALAEELKLKGLTGVADAEAEDIETPQTRRKVSLKKETSQQIPAPRPQSNIESPSHDSTVALTSDKIVVELQDLDDQIKSMITKSDISYRNNYSAGKMASCNICGKEGPYMTMPRHIEANHITGVSHACDICGKVSRSRNALKTHKMAYQGNRKMLQD